MNFRALEPLAFGVLFGMIWGCGTIRDTNVYTAEIQFEDMTARRAAPAVRRVLMTDCTCDATTFAWTATTESVTNATCEANADWYRTYVGRWAWHVAMQRYNGGVEGATDPGQPPEIVHSCDLPEEPAALATAGGAS